MPSRPIQGFPSGLLSLLGLKNLGKLPDTLLDDVRATFELAPWYVRGLRAPVYGGGTTVATGGLQVASYSGAVPAGQLWYLHSASVQVQSAANATQRAFCTVGIFDAIYPVLRESQVELVSSNFVGGYGEAICTLRDTWLYPGESVRNEWYLDAGDTVLISPIYVSAIAI